MHPHPTARLWGYGDAKHGHLRTHPHKSSKVRNTKMNIQVFQSPDFEIRGGLVGDEPFFVASDIAKALGYRDAFTLVRRLDDDEKGKKKVRTLGGEQDMLVINESGLYSSIFGSNRAEAKRFKRWVTSEVLPSIRKTGGYYIQNFQIPQTLSEALHLAAKQAEQIEKQQAQIEYQRPLVAFAESVNATQNSLLIRDWAKNIGVKESQARAWLEDHRYIYRQNGQWRMYARKDGYFEQVLTTRSTPRGSFSSITVKITGKGQTMLTERILKFFKGEGDE